MYSRNIREREKGKERKNKREKSDREIDRDK